MSYIDTNLATLEAFSRMSKAVGARVDYVQGGGGNTSAKMDDGTMAIKASGYRLSDIVPDDGYAVIRYKEVADFYRNSDPAQMEDVEKTGSETVKGLIVCPEGLKALRPSVEAGFHAILRRFVVHSHSVYANLACCAAECDEILAEVMKDSEESYCVIPYTDPGARLTFSILAALDETEARTGKRPQVIFLKNHGLIATSDDAEECERLHDAVNARLAAYFGVDMANYPVVAVKAEGEAFLSDTAYLAEQFKKGTITPEGLLAQPLYPDQMVYLAGTLLTAEEDKADSCYVQSATGKMVYHLSEGKAKVIEETVTAVAYIFDLLAQKGLTIVSMDAAARSFIAGWESEKYRKSISK